MTTEISDFQWFKPALENHKDDYIKLQFVDPDGFNLAEHTIKLKDRLTNVVDNNGKLSGLRYEGSFKVNPLVLSKANSLQYVYLIETLKDAPQ